VLGNYLKLKSELDNNYMPSLLEKSASQLYQASDLVSYNNNKNIGYVLQVQEDFLKVISDRGELLNLKLNEVNKKITKE